MDKTYLIKLIVTFLIIMLSFNGLNVNMYCWRTKKFYINYCLLAWSIVTAIIFSVIYIPSFYSDFISGELNFKDAVKVYYYMNIIAAVINYLSQLLNCRDLVEFFNIANIFEILEYFNIENKVICSSVLMVIMKTIIVPLIIEITLILKHLRYENEDKSILWTIYILYPLIIANIIPNCLFGIFVIFRQYTIALNHCLCNLKQEANFLQNTKEIVLHKHFYRMQTFCNLADKLNILAEKYLLICKQTLRYMSLCAVPLLASILCNLFGITAGLFRQYYALANTLFNGECYDIFNAITNGIFLVISFLDIILYSLVTHRSIEAIKETGIILKRIKLDFADVRFRQALEDFSFNILIIDYKIQPLGLLNIDLGLLHQVISAVASFLLILIQSDLTLRFSLK